MIKNLKIKFIALSMMALFLLLTVIVSGMNLMNYNSVVTEADQLLQVLSQNKGDFPDFKDGMQEKPDFLPPRMSPETPYESRYFSVVIDFSGNIIEIETRRIITVDENQAVEYAKKAINDKNGKGFAGDFRFLCSKELKGTRITFLDCGRRLNAFYEFLRASIIMSVVGYIIILLIIIVLSEKIIKPISESYNKQKRFITDAGHEIKTPLTIINANLDLLEMEIGANESVDEIKTQTKRLTTLTNDLVYLSKMEEAENDLIKVEFPLSDLVFETASTFKALAQTQNKELLLNIQPMLSFCGNDKAIEQLISILMNNALRYSQEGGKIAVNLVKNNKQIQLNVFNTTKDYVSQESLRYVFDRFYRADSSRNSGKGGHGIGLSVAKAIVEAHNGKIKAYTNDGQSFNIELIFNQ